MVKVVSAIAASPASSCTRVASLSENGLKINRSHFNVGIFFTIFQLLIKGAMHLKKNIALDEKPNCPIYQL